MVSIGIVAMDYYLPEKRKGVTDVFRDEEIPLGSLSKKVDFERDIGIDAVHVADEMPSEMALNAAQKALNNAQLDPEQVDVVVGFSTVPEDYVGPTWSSAGLVQDQLGLKRAFTTAVNTGGCASYHTALKATCALMAANDNINVAMLVAGARTPLLNKVYYPITVASDGGCAIILRKHYNRRLILGIETFSVGRLHDVWYVPGLPRTRPNVPLKEKHLHMHCDLQKFNREVIPKNFFMFRKAIDAVLRRVNLEQQDIDFYIYPSFSSWDQAYFMKSMDIPPSRIYLDNLKRIGHVQECDMVINYVDAVRENRIREGDIVMVVSNGAGFSWAAAIIRH